MFEIPEGNLPIVRTGQALLVIDLQNDFVSTGSILSVDKPADLLDKIADLVPRFRKSGKIIWVHSEFHTYRPVNDGSGDGERIITDDELNSGSAAIGAPARRPRMPSKTLMALYERMLAETEEDDADGALNNKDDSDERYNNEAFLTPEPGQRARCVTPMSLGANYNQVVASLVDLSKDTFSRKSHYSAFKDDALLQALRGQFVTELFLCGVLTNIGIFATAMDAARYGYTITLVEDCAGYRSKERHDEAIRQLVETTGCAVMSSSEIVEEMKAKELVQNQASNSKKAGRNSDSRRNLPHMMNNLKIGNSSPQATETDRRPTSRQSAGSSIEDVQASGPNGKTANSNESLKSIRATPGEIPRDESPSETRYDCVPNKRVPSKIRARRRSKSNLNDKNQSSNVPKAGSGESDRTTMAPVSPMTTNSIKPADAPGTITPTQEEDSVKTPVEQTDIPTDIKPERPTDSKGLQTNPNIADSKQSIIAEEPKEATNFVELSKENVTGPDQQSNVEDDSLSICEGDSKIIYNLLPPSEAFDIFEKVRDEVHWQKMSHQGGEVPRLVAVQGEIDEDGGIPIYRHPADESPPLLPFSPFVLLIKSQVEDRVGHKVNHCLIQFYRNGTDYISEHSDKTLDIAPNSFIANVSLGAMRAMTFRTKKPLKTHPKHVSEAEEAAPRLSSKAMLPHNSMCKLGLRTNARWLHGIRQDKRRTEEKSEAELAYDGGRISLTFRLIGTFLDRTQTKIWGQDAVAKGKKDALSIINGETPEAIRMLRAFGTENHSSDFGWQESYGKGFNVLHLFNTRKLFLSGDPVTDIRVKLSLSQHDLPWTVGLLSPSFNWKQVSADKTDPEIPDLFPIRLVDNDISRAQVRGDIAILLYLDGSYGPTGASGTETPSQVQKAHQYTRLIEIEHLLQSWRAQPFQVRPFRTILALWNGYASEDMFIAGPKISITDLAFWPVLREIVNEWGDGVDSPNLKAYYERVGALEIVKKALEEGQENGEKVVEGKKDGVEEK